MSSRSRQSRVGAIPSNSRLSVATAPAPTQPNALPAYKKPSHPLDGEAQRALRELNGPTLTIIKKHSKDAITTIRSTAEGVNDMLSEHQRYFDARSKKWDAGKKLDEREDEEAIMADLQQKVDDATAKLEESMRAAIDSSVAAQRIEDALEWLRQHAPKQIEEEYHSQRTRRSTQRRQTQNRDGSEAGSDQEELDDGPTPGPTPLDRSQLALTGSVDMFTDRMAREQTSYTSLSLTARYARHNEYRDFKRVVHDARYGDTIPLGHEDTWFTETGEPALGVTQAVNDDEDDLVMDRATVSTKCPITFQTLKEPWSSAKCPHTFEKSAILGMIRTSASHFGPGRARSVACPIPGCDQQLSAEDLHSDPILTRKIRRLLQAQLDDDDDDDGDDDEDEDEEEEEEEEEELPQSSIIEDLGDPSEDEDE
ncbi:uncharacterized protein M421DRAFT_76501 [Didymella exigua CBS 183.55]|uniref:SP-RING-type domain-containing protein n=1 Tax=Didymella exigua CBS 183.55 TaxID=1150837 RepID=A0A6A5R6J9_9PLEO|nr:uncharacterized protein M421DRAFT_76501 [Didymella exigua CBS 183.55]KAF1923019.1 hypothetical protein M421DRAFT_76501 [Didymella exigua CBS 183.55]